MKRSHSLFAHRPKKEPRPSKNAGSPYWSSTEISLEATNFSTGQTSSPCTSPARALTLTQPLGHLRTRPCALTLARSPTHSHRRLGEKDRQMDPEEKQLLRYQRQRQKEFSRKSIFNLSDDEGEDDDHPRGTVTCTPGMSVCTPGV